MEEEFSRPKPFSLQPSDLAHSVGLCEGHFSSWSRMLGGIPCPSLRCSPSGTGCNHMLFRQHRVAPNAFIQITRFEASSLISTSNLHKAILFSQHVWSPVVLYYYYFFLLHPLYKFHSCKLPLQLLSSSWQVDSSEQFTVEPEPISTATSDQKTLPNLQKINNSELHVQTTDISSLRGSLHHTLLQFLRPFFFQKCWLDPSGLV